jgi:hypothetical protein
MAQTMDISEKAARAIRAAMKRSPDFYGPYQIEAVAWVKRFDNEFASIVVPNERPEALEALLDVLTDPRSPFVVVRDHTGKYDTRIYVALAAGSTGSVGR